MFVVCSPLSLLCAYYGMEKWQWFICWDPAVTSLFMSVKTPTGFQDLGWEGFVFTYIFSYDDLLFIWLNRDDLEFFQVVSCRMHSEYFRAKDTRKLPWGPGEQCHCHGDVSVHWESDRWRPKLPPPPDDLSQKCSQIALLRSPWGERKTEYDRNQRVIVLLIKINLEYYYA